MSDIDFLPVRPNINNSEKILRHSIKQKTTEQDQGIFANSKDSDVQQFINKKKIDAFSSESPSTKEEQRDQRDKKDKTDKKSEDAKKNEGSSWIIIILAIIVIILILIIVYYVINYNNLSVGQIIPESVVKPTITGPAVNPISYASPSQINPTSQINPPSHAPPSQNNAPKKPRNYVEPTKKDLDAALSKLSVIEELGEESEDKSDDIEHADKNDIEIDLDVINLDDYNNYENNDQSNTVDPDVIEDFINQA
jgi:flagellar basal body-associated protein FliL